MLKKVLTKLSTCRGCKHADPAGVLGCKCKRDDCVCNVTNQKWG